MIISGQSITFLIAVGIGFVLGIFYDIFRIIRHSGLNKFFIYLCDIAFWLTVTITMFFAFLHVNFGEMRFFIFLGFGVGICIYFCTLSRFIVKAGIKVKKGLHQTAKYVRIKSDKFTKEVKGYGAKICKRKHGSPKKAD